MMNSSRVRKGARTLAESSSSTSSASSSSSTGDSVKVEDMNNGSISERNRPNGGAEKGDAASEPACSSSLFPRLPGAVPLLTEKQQQLLLRYLCVSNDEASRILMQAAARQRIYSATGQAKTAVEVGDRTTAATIVEPGTPAASPALPQGGESPGTSGGERRSFPPGQRAAARASCSSPVSPFAAAPRSTSNDSRAAAAVKFSGSTGRRLMQGEASSWTSSKETDLPLQPQFKRRSQQHECVLVPRPHPQVLYIEQQRGQQTMMPQKEQQQTQHHQMNLRDTVDGSGLPAAAGDSGATQVVYPLRPCLRRRSNVRFRSPVAEESEEQQDTDDSASRRVSIGVHASPSETHNSPSVATTDTIVSSTSVYGRKSFSFSSASHTSCCFPSCHGRDAPSSHSARPGLLHAPPNHALDTSYGTGLSECPNNVNSQNCVQCCFRCSASAACSPVVSRVPGVQCCCGSRLLCHDRQAAAQTPAGEPADPRGEAIPTVAQQASLLPATPASSVPCKHWDAEASVEDSSYCCRVACPSSGRRENLCCCCCMCCNPSFYLDEAFSTSSHDEQEEKTCRFPSSSLRQRVPRTLVPAIATPEDKANTYVAGESASTGAGAARGATTRRQVQVRGEGGGAGTIAQLERSTARQLFCRYLPSHEEEGPRPCCGPGNSEKEMITRQQQAPDEEQDEEVCCCSCSRRIPVSDPQRKTVGCVVSNARGRDKVRSCFVSATRHPLCTILEPHTVISADFLPLTAADARQAAAPAQQQDARGADEKGRSPLQHSNSCMRRCCIQQQQRDRLPTGCSRHTEHVCQMGNEQQCCAHVHLPFPVTATTAPGEEISCCSGAGSLLHGRQNASSSLALNTMKRSKQYVLQQRHLQQEQRRAQQYQMEQRQQPFTVQQSSEPSTELQQSPQEERSHLRPITPSTEQADSFQKYQQQLCVHSRGCAADSVQRRYIYFKPAGATAKTPTSAAGVPTAGGAHTTSAAATLSSTAPWTTQACTPTPGLEGKGGRTQGNVGEIEISNRLRNISPRLPAGRASLARTLKAVTPLHGVAAREIAAVQTAATRVKATARRAANAQVATASGSTAAGMSSEGTEKTMLLEGRPWKFEAVAWNTQPQVGKGHALSDSKSLASVESGSEAVRVSAAPVAAQPSAMATLASRAVSGVNAIDWGSDLSAERGFRREGACGTLGARNTDTPIAAIFSGAVTPATSPAACYSAAVPATISPVAGVGNSTGAPAPNATVAWPEARAGDEQLGEDLQQLLQRQQEELAEQLRRLDVLEKRQQQLRQPQLRRRQDWWQRLQALEQQLQRRKVALEQQQQQPGVGMQQVMNQDSLKQQLLQSSGENHQTQEKGLYWSSGLEQQPQQPLQINGQQQPADKGMPESHLQQRRESRVLSAGGGQKRVVRDASGIARSSSSGSCSQSSASRIFTHIIEKEQVSQCDSAAAPASLVVLSRSTRKFQPPLSEQQQQRQHRLQRQRLHQQGGRQQQQETERQRHHQVEASEKWVSQPKDKAAVSRSGVAMQCENSCADPCPSGQPCFTVESEQLLLDEDDEEQELLELQEISEALEAAEF